jgi:hypothetical protein
MNQRIARVYKHARLCQFYYKGIANAKINFVSEELASQGFTPSVFSDLPTKGNTQRRKNHKRELESQVNQLNDHQNSN